MTKQILFIHSAGPQGEHEGSFDLIVYLQDNLNAEYNLIIPEMPNPENPEYTRWKERLSKEFASLEGEVILIGHSLGGSVLLKYLSEEDCHLKISSLHSVAAPYWGKNGFWESEEFALSENFAAKLPPISQVFFYHSRDDEVVSFDHFKEYTEEFLTAAPRAIENKGHLFHSGLPELVNDIKGL
ncbi:alpha/beta hydrolase [Virgibacillus sp. JSM 102003]|uniref:alpha/beta hydrolase n=1 Tax=Virgibacillus sp. JSM 102003 TaxID=1562108 RepID=UPI0035BEF3D6